MNGTKRIIQAINKLDDNYVYSPVAIYYALALLAQITDGDTKEELLEVLNVNKDELLDKAKEIYSKLNNEQEDEKIMLNSSFWINKNASIIDDAINQIANSNNTMIKAGEMGNSEFDKEIQDWINKNTRNLLKDSVSNLRTNPNEILELITTIYLKASWVHDFDKEDTKERNFYISKSQKEKCSFINRLSGADDLFVGKHFTAIKMFFNRIGYMSFVLPNDGYTPKDIQNDDDLIKFLNGETDHLEKKVYDIDISIPKFDINADDNITEQLKALGVTSALDMNKADFSPITNEKQIYLSDAKQASRIKIDENGVEAASYVKMAMCFGCCIEPLERIKFTLNKPFMFSVISDEMPLFIGTVTNPNKN